MEEVGSNRHAARVVVPHLDNYGYIGYDRVCKAGGACRSYCDIRQDALFFNAIPGNAWWWFGAAGIHS